MNNLLLSFASLPLAIIVGTIVFQSFVVAPTVFKVLGKEQARDFLRTLFPRFFRLNAGLAMAASAALAAGGAAKDWSPFFVWSSVGAAAIALFMLLSLSMVGSINAARDRGESGTADFARLHRVTVLLTVLSLMIGAAILSALGATSTGY